jgi:hypothetical protein
MAMPKYRKKPVVIEAEQFFYKDFGKYPSTDIRSNVSVDDDTGKFIIETLEGNHIVSDGDYIIEGIQGELYSCKPDIFEETYEIMEGCIAYPHWKACKTCKYNDSRYGCVIKERIPLSLHEGDFILCDDYEANKSAQRSE